MKEPARGPANRTTSVVIVAAGQSSRMATADATSDTPRKPFVVLEGLTLLEHACHAFDPLADVREIVIVGHEGDLERIRRMARSCPSMRKVSHVVAGGELRVDSVRAGTQAADASLGLVAIHDAARPLVETELIARAIEVAATRGAALVAVPVTDTIKTSPDGEHVENTLHRSVLWSAQTPQIFAMARFRELLEKARAESFRPTDDSSLYEKYVGPVPIVQGDTRNLKVTTPDDLVIAAAILRSRASSGARRT
jgi:2-C-methyl-D-erythritol 4-phosphate cytidylyltransferase